VNIYSLGGTGSFTVILIWYTRELLMPVVTLGYGYGSVDKFNTCVLKL